MQIQPIRQQEIDSHAALIPIRAIVEQGGALFVGIQPGYPEHGIETLVLFRHPNGTTLALKISKLTTAAVFQKVLETTSKFQEAPCTTF